MRPSTRTQADSLFFDTTFGAADSWQSIQLTAANLPLDTFVWINLSDLGSSTFTATAGTSTVNLAARERRLRFDSFAFGTTADRATITDTDLSNAVHRAPRSHRPPRPAPPQALNFRPLQKSPPKVSFAGLFCRNGSRFGIFKTVPFRDTASPKDFDFIRLNFVGIIVSLFWIKGKNIAGVPADSRTPSPWKTEPTSF